ncbi:MAG TPA: MerR family transcriptional regulator [Bryobacteraceae bacterium]|nr:MerR family transcriptional regulator [Bryobacteraceae bacterium]
MRSLTIGQVARKAGLRASAIRYYERAGLLPKPQRAGGQRRYNNQIFDRLALVEFAKECGFSLSEIRAMFGGFEDDAPLSVRTRDWAVRKVEQLDALSKRIDGMRVKLARAARCRCADLGECGRRLRADSACR